MSRLKGVSASKGGMTPKVGRTWKSSAPSLRDIGLEEAQTRTSLAESQCVNLQDVIKVCPLRAYTDIVEHGITFSELELGATRLKLQGLLDLVEVLVSTRRSVVLRRQKSERYGACIICAVLSKSLQVKIKAQGTHPGKECSYLGASTGLVTRVGHNLLNTRRRLIRVV